MKIVYSTFILFLLSGYVLALSGQNLEGTSLQGYLKNASNGLPVDDGSYAMKVSLRDSHSGSILWSKNINNVPVNRGVFSITLSGPDISAQNLSAVFKTSPVFPASNAATNLVFDIQVDFDSNGSFEESFLALPLTSVPFAFVANSCYNVADASVTAAKLTDGTITFAKIAQNGASSGDVIQWDGTDWVASPLDASTQTSYNAQTAGTGFQLGGESALSSAGGALTLGKSNSFTSLNFATAGTTRMSLDSSGKLGIGTALPTAGLHVATNGLESLPGLKVDGQWFTSGGTATTTKPYLLVEPAGTTSTNWSTAGTAVGVNAAFGFVGNLLDMQVNGSSKMKVRSDGIIGIGEGTNEATLSVSPGQLNFHATKANMYRIVMKANEGVFIDSPLQVYQLGAKAGLHSLTANFDFTTNYAFTNTTGMKSGFFITQSFNPASGTGLFNALELKPIINQVGGANGITRGIFLNPTLTAATDFRAIELGNASGFGLYQSELTTKNFLNGSLGLGVSAPTGRLEVVSDGTNPAATFLGSNGKGFQISKDGHFGPTDGNANTALSVGYESGLIFTGGVGNISRHSGTGLGYTVANSYRDGHVFKFTGTNTISVANSFLHQLLGTFAPTAGSYSFTTQHVNPTINQTGTANGITRGIYVNPTLTSAADFRAIETTKGKNLFSDSLTGAENNPTLEVAPTWNTTGTPTALKVSVTDTASSNGYLMNVSRNGVQHFGVRKDNLIVMNQSPTFTTDYSNGLFTFDAGLNRSWRLAGGRTAGFSAYPFSLSSTFNPASGSDSFAQLHVNPTVNQTGGADGVIRGIYINPTLTSATDFRGLEVKTSGSAKGIVIDTNAAQSANLQEWRVNGALVSLINPSGNFETSFLSFGSNVIRSKASNFHLNYSGAGMLHLYSNGTTTPTATLKNENFGIGIQDPNEKLEVSGNIRITTYNGGGLSNAQIDNNGNIVRDASDARLKKNITPITGALEKVTSMRGITYDWIDGRHGGKRDVGFIAQELERVVPEVVSQAVSGEKFKAVNYGHLTAVVVEGIKQFYDEFLFSRKKVNQEINSLKLENSKLRSQLDMVIRRMERLERKSRSGNK